MKGIDDQRPGRRLGDASLSWLFLIYALPTILFLAVAMAPFQVADEYAHAMRVDQISRGTLISPRLGGFVDGALSEYGLLFDDLRFHSETKLTVEIARDAARIKWSLPDKDENFQNTAQYGPLLYLPQAAATWVSKRLGISPVWTILAARLVNALVAVLAGFVSLRLCRRGQAMMFTTLLLPMTMSEFASVSQDAQIISLSILSIAIASRIIAENRAARTWEFLVFVLTVVATMMARPSQFALVVIGIAFVNRREDPLWLGKLVLSVIGLVAVGWWMNVLPTLMPEAGPSVSYHDQLVAIRSHPFLLPLAILNSFRESGVWLFKTLVGLLGWVDTPLPGWYYPVAAGLLVFASLAPGNARPSVLPGGIALLGVGAMLLAISVGLYTSWTPVRQLTINGLQGRYMLPVLPLLGWIAPVYRPEVARSLSFVWIPVVAFPLLSMAVLPGSIMSRYYVSWSQMELILKTLYLT